MSRLPGARPRRAPGRLGVALLGAVLLLLGLPVQAASAATTGTTWVASGPTAATVSDGSVTVPSFTYDHRAFSGEWSFLTTATSAGTVTLPYTWTGLHSWYQVRTQLETLVLPAAGGGTATTLVAQGPVNCCVTPSNGFTYEGQAAFTVDAGDRYGFRLRGSHGDSGMLLRGTLTLGIAPSISVPASPLAVPATSADGAVVTYTASATDREFGGVAPVTCAPASGSTLPVGDTTVTCSATSRDGFTVQRSFTVTVTPPPVIPDPGNTAWPTALPTGATGTASGFVDALGQARWFRFPVQPDSTVEVTLSGLPADYDLALFRDIGQAFDTATSVRDLNLLGAEFAPDAYSPSAFSPSAFSPSAFSPSAFSPSAFSPSAFSPSAFSPSAFSPSAFSPSAFSPSAFSPSAFSPSAFSPSTDPATLLRGTDLSIGQIQDAFSSAQTRSLVAVSARDGLADEAIRASTWNASGSFYVRVQGRNGAFDADRAKGFTLSVSTSGGACGQPLDTFPDEPTRTGAPGAARTVIITDSSRLPGTAVERAALAEQLAAFAQRSEVRGVVVDAAAVPRVAALNGQADRLVDCAHAKNLVAQELRGIVNSHRDGAGTLQYVVLVGDDDVIPFFRSADGAGLGPEENYVPPVREGTGSQASLRGNQVLSQDAYGARTDVTLKGATVPLADLAVGRLVETPAEIGAALARYADLEGVLPRPDSMLVTGYDFLTDAADAVVRDWGAGLGTAGRSTELITDQDVPFATTTVGGVPSRRTSWTADDLRRSLRTGTAGKHDLVYLAGHFSANSALAADNATSVVTTELLGPEVDLENTLVLSAGCHSGYNIVDGHGVAGMTLGLDWVQLMAQKGATFVAGTGYQYGDTDFLEYSERLYADLTAELREGAGAVPIGTALTRAKQDYLATTPVLSGIHQKALLEATLYGLPMLGLDLPAGRVTPQAVASLPTSPVTTGPGAVLGLQSATVTADGATTPVTKPIDGGGEFTWSTGPDGVVTSPGQPALPLESLSVGARNAALRGAVLLSGSYTDTPGVIPLTGAPATEFSETHTAFRSPVFFPRRLATVNAFGAIEGDGGTRLLVTPAQHRSDPASDRTATVRRHTDLEFQLLYSANTATYGGTGNQPALAAPPALSDVGSTVTGSAVSFRARAVGDPSAGIQQLWVTYTAEAGPLHGLLQSIALTQDSGDSTLWTGSLSLPAGQAAGAVRFLVQAANGVGLVTVDDNQGYEYRLDTAPGLDPVPVDRLQSALSLTAPPTGLVGGSVTLSASLTAGEALAGRTVEFSLGSTTIPAITGTDGVATAVLPLGVGAGSHPVTAGFAGDLQATAARATGDVTVTKRPSAVTLNAGEVAALRLVDPGLTVTLTSDGQPVADRPVYFVLRRDGQVVGGAVRRTGTSGRASLGPVDLPGGTYTVTAVFGADAVPLPDGTTTRAVDSLYTASQSSSAGLLVRYGFGAFGAPLVDGATAETAPSVSANATRPVKTSLRDGGGLLDDATSSALAARCAVRLTSTDTASGSSSPAFCLRYDAAADQFLYPLSGREVGWQAGRTYRLRVEVLGPQGELLDERSTFVRVT